MTEVPQWISRAKYPSQLKDESDIQRFVLLARAFLHYFCISSWWNHTMSSPRVISCRHSTTLASVRWLLHYIHQVLFSEARVSIYKPIYAITNLHVLFGHQLTDWVQADKSPMFCIIVSSPHHVQILNIMVTDNTISSNILKYVPDALRLWKKFAKWVILICVLNRSIKIHHTYYRSENIWVLHIWSI